MFTRLINYIKETRQELHKVNWPTRKETIQHTLLVIGISIGVALFLGAFDYLYRFILNEVIF
ncbi:MAG: preprotein translocase subunit SecE [Candidatus Ryanbacteria bacterium]|nr:preprotein translocase subunit SecE [Candidatus Ryanbacteria bacterium]